MDPESREGITMKSKPVRLTRNIVGAVCLVLAAFLAVSANFGVFVKRELYNTTAFENHTANLIANPDVRESISKAITDQIVQNVPQLKNFQGLATTAVSTLVGTNEFRNVFDNALASAQQQIVAGNDSITLDLGAAAQPLVNELTGGIPFIKTLLPDLKGVLVVTVLTRADAPDLWTWVERTDTASRWALILTIVLLIAGVLLVTKHWIGTAAAGGAIVAAAIMGFVSSWGFSKGFKSQFSPGLEQRTFSAVYHEFAGAYASQTFVMLVLGVFILAIGLAGELALVSARHRRHLAPERATGGSGQASTPTQPTSGPAASASAAAVSGSEPRKGPPLLD